MPVMNDDVEDRLRKYRPSGPPPELRDRVLRATLVAWPFQGRVSRVARPVVSGVARPFQGRDLVREWLPATLAASVAIIFHLLASSAHADVTSRLAVDHVHEAMVADLASQFGGDELARDTAERLVEADEQAARSQTDLLDGSDAQVTNHD